MPMQEMRHIEEYDTLALLQTRASLRRDTMANASPFSKIIRKIVEKSSHNHVKNLTFLHVPKNAGTTIEELALQHDVHWGKYMHPKWPHKVTFESSILGRPSNDSKRDATMVHKFFPEFKVPRVQMPDGHMCNFYHIPPMYSEAPSAYNDGEVFCITRNPYERLVSEYKYLISAWKKGYTYPPIMSDALREYPYCTKSGLNHFLQSELTKYFDGERFRLDCHLLPQTEYIFGDSGEKRDWCTDVLRTDQLVDSFNTLMESKGYSMRLREKKKTKTTDEFCQHITTKDIDVHSRRLMVKAYHRDFKLLGYPTEL